MGSAAPAAALQRDPDAVLTQRDLVEDKPSGQAPAVQVESRQGIKDQDPQEKVRAAVLQALSESGQNFLISLLSGGEWSVRGNELVIEIAESQTVLDMSLGNDARRLVIASASGVLGRAVKLRVIPGATVASQPPRRNGGPPPSSGVGGRGRAEQDPIVRRMQEKFGAEIRTVIDYREKH